VLLKIIKRMGLNAILRAFLHFAHYDLIALNIVERITLYYICIINMSVCPLFERKCLFRSKNHV